MKVLMGLGNPGMTYAKTRHNVGFMVIERLARRRNLKLTERVLDEDGRPSSVFGEYDSPEGERVRLVMPLTMMNDSGRALQALEAVPASVLVIYDDVNLALGRVRLRPSGGPGGHHGMESCIVAAGTEDIPRLRLGVGIDPLPSDLKDFVLSPFFKEEKPMVEAMIEQAADACEAWIRDGMEVAMNSYNVNQE